MGAINPIKKTDAAETPTYDDGLSGVLMRMRNLGYYNGHVPSGHGEDEIDPAEYASPIAAFQIHKMKREADQVNGELDDETRQALSDESIV